MTMHEETEVENNIPASETKQSDKELNFRAQQAKYERMLAEERRAREEERQAREDLERRIHSKSRYAEEEEEEDDEPYVDKKKLKKQLAKFGEVQEKHTESKIQNAVQQALEEERKNQYLDSHPDFFEVLRDHAEKLAVSKPELAKTILKMPEGFERQKLVYHSIKDFGLDRPMQKQPTIQDKIEMNRKSPYYQPSGVGTAPYSSQSDFSPQGQKQAYDKMQELKSRLRL